MTEFLHEVVRKRNVDVADPWAVAIRRDNQVRYASDSVHMANAMENLLEWLQEQQREEDNVTDI
tara:strand:- start:1570 stop:1761 length:192 start_codon:yes stop_codon:yes gene_type:complete